jgi:hypothetical protein
VGASSYHGEVRCKQRLLERVRTRALQSESAWVKRPVYWNGTAGSFVGSLLQGDDLSKWERLFGLPKWMALAIDTLFAEAPDLQQGIASGISFLEAVPIGADLRTAGNQMLHELLSDGEGSVASLLPTDLLRDVARSVANLHGRTLQGFEVTPEEWRIMRRYAVAKTDLAEVKSIESVFGACIEAAAWDPTTSRTAVSDTCVGYIRATTELAVARHSNWTSDDDDRIRALLNSLHANAVAQEGYDGSFVDVFKLLAEHHPKQAGLLQEHINLEGRFGAEQWQYTVNLLKRVLSDSMATSKVA